MAAGSGVLIVQDDFLVAQRLRGILEGAGEAVAGIARDTAEALALLERHGADVAVVDMKLEVDVDGIQTATELKRRYPRLRILLTTGFPDHVVEAHGTDELACAVVKKPYTDQEILDALKRCRGRGAGS